MNSKRNCGEIEVYRNAVSFFMNVCAKEWGHLERYGEIERLTLETKKNVNPKYDFNKLFYLQNGVEKYNYSICMFQNGKQYHCDLNASYNIGARYFVGERLKSDSVMRRLPSQIKNSDYGTGSTRTLSTLIRLHADMRSLAI